MHKWENFDKAIDWIYSFTNLERDIQKRKNKDSFQLEPIKKMNDYFHKPSEKFKIIHIAGSKGKGTVAYLLSKYYENMGLKVGLYISPHIIDVRERIQINGQLINKEDFIKILSDIHEYVSTIENKSILPSFFDIFTELAFIYFSINKVDLAIIEVGLGGRLDSTNIVNPIISVITSITKEHTDVLGKTLKKIAYEKGGIIKNNIPVILGKNKKEVIKRIEKIAEIKKSKLYYAEDFVKIKIRKFILENSTIYSQCDVNLIKSDEFFAIKSSLIGEFQNENIETAICTILLLEKLLNLKFIKNIFEKVLIEAYWPSRFELKKYQGRFIIIDGAHTKESMKKLIFTVKKLIKGGILKKDIAIIIGMMKDKDHKGMLENLMKISSFFYFVELDKWKDSKVSNYLNLFTQLVSEKKSDDIINSNIEYFIKEGTEWKGEEILNKILQINPKIQTFLVTGSLYLAQYFKDL